MRSFRARKLVDDHLAEAMKSPTPLAHSLKSRMLAASGSMVAQSEIYDEAVSEAHRAVALDANDATAYAALANALIYAGEPADHIARVYSERKRNYVGQHFWARGYFVSTVGRDEEVIREYIRHQERGYRRVDQLNLM
jgi:putative transposase